MAKNTDTEKRELYLSNATIIDYITNGIKKDFTLDDLDTKLGNAITHRDGTWTEGAEIGRQIQIGDFAFMKQGILGQDRNDTSSTQLKLWSINFLETNISTNIAHFVSTNVDIKIKNDSGSNKTGQILLEQECNFANKRFRILRQSDACLWDSKFTGMGYSYCSWNPYKVDRNWLNGKPEFERIDPFNVYLDPDCRGKDKTKRNWEFVMKLYDRDLLKNIYEDKAADIGGMKKNARDVNRDNQNLVEVAMYNFKVVKRIKKRALVDEDSKKMIFIMEHELEDYINEKYPGEDFDSIQMKELKLLAQEEDVNDIFGDRISVSEPIESDFEAWFSMKYVPGTKIILEEPEYIGPKDNIEILPCNWLPDSAYAMGDAYKQKDLLETDVLLMTVLMLDTIKVFKPLIIAREKGIENFEEVRKNWGNPNLLVVPDEEWEKRNMGLKPIEVIDMPKPGNLQILLSEKLQMASDKSQQAPNVMKGIPDYAQQPAKGTIALQDAAVEGAKGDYEDYKEFLRGLFESLRYNIALNRTYEHTIWGIDPVTRAMGEIKVNDEQNPETFLYDVIDSCWVDIDIDETSGQKTYIKEQKMTNLFANGAITYEDYMRSQNLENAEALIENKKKQDQNMMIMEALNKDPQLRGLFLDALQNNGLLDQGGQEQPIAEAPQQQPIQQAK